MTHQRIQLNWTIDEAEYLKNSKRVRQTIENRKSKHLTELQLTSQSIRCLILTVAAMMLLTSRPPLPPQSDGVRVQRGIAMALAQEEKAWETNDLALFQELVDPQVAASVRQSWRINWQQGQHSDQTYTPTLLDTERIDNLSLAYVRFDRPSGRWWLSSPYRETRFYHETSAGWMRTIPALQYWGVRRTFDTAHLQFEFRDRDATTINTIAQQIEQEYVELYKILGLEAPQPADKLIIALMPNDVGRRQTIGNRLEFTSPQLSLIPATMSDAEFIHHYIMSRLTYRAVTEAMSNYRNRNQYQWENVIWGFTGWLRTDILGQRAPWHEQAERLFKRNSHKRLPLSLSSVTSSEYFMQPNQENIMWHYIATESVIDYALNTYGRHKIPALLQAFSDHETWMSLIPAVFELPAEQFELDWNQSLYQKYHPSISISPSSD
ncbi:hypothetical protein KFU94_33125 [Chloroflexi bacterium TSY]|nr:hypothetical protein [Chloroflexi bacterium TSY]